MKRRILVCSKVLGSGLQWLCVGVWIPGVHLASTASTWPSLMVGNDAKWLFSCWMLLWQSEVALFLTIAGAEVLDVSNSFELSLTSEAHQDTVSQELEEYWLPHKNETCEPYVIKQYNNQAKVQQSLWLSGVEEPSSLILRSWISRKRANMAGAWDKAVKIYWRSQSYFLEMQLKFVSQKGNYLVQTKTYIRQRVLPCHRGCRLLQERRLAAEWYIEHEAAVLIKQHTDLQTTQVRTMAGIWKETTAISVTFQDRTKRTIASCP